MMRYKNLLFIYVQLAIITNGNVRNCVRNAAKINKNETALKASIKT